MTTEIQLPKSSMGFKLEDGSTFFISEEDIKLIGQKAVTEIMINHPERIFVLTDIYLERAKFLANTILSIKDLDISTFDRVVEEILNLLSQTNIGPEVQSLMDKMKKQ